MDLGTYLNISTEYIPLLNENIAASSDIQDFRQQNFWKHSVLVLLYILVFAKPICW